MKALSPEALKRMALKHGAKLEVDGKSINAARTKIDAPRKLELVKPETAYMPEATPAPAPETVKADSSEIAEAVSAIDRYAAASFLVNDSNQRVLGAIQDVLAKVSEPKPDAPVQKRPVRWVFTVKRDMRGLMEKVEATAVFD